MFDVQPLPEHISQPLHDLVNLILMKNPDERPRLAVNYSHSCRYQRICSFL